MPVGIEDTVIVKNVGSRHEAFEEVFKAYLFAFWEVTGRHVWCVVDEHMAG